MVMRCLTDGDVVAAVSSPSPLPVVCVCVRACVSVCVCVCVCTKYMSFCVPKCMYVEFIYL